MNRHFLLTVFAFTSFLIHHTAQAQKVKQKPRYDSVTLCDLSLHQGATTPHSISVDAEYFSAVPHGIFLNDHRCPAKVLQIDFGDTDLDPSVAFIKRYIFQIHQASGTFRGILKQTCRSGGRCLWLQSVVNFKPSEDLPEFHLQEPIQLPEPPLPKWPTSP
jgi:hypothetical protein